MFLSNWADFSISPRICPEVSFRSPVNANNAIRGLPHVPQEVDAPILPAPNRACRKGSWLRMGWFQYTWVVVEQEGSVMWPGIVHAVAITVGGLAALQESVPTDSETDVAFISRLDGTEQRYVLWMPSGVMKPDGLAILVALHGHGSDRWQFIRDPRDECRALRDVARRHGSGDCFVGLEALLAMTVGVFLARQIRRQQDDSLH